MEEILLKMLEAHRALRHDYVNHLQVISGYLQLGWFDKAREYILKTTESLNVYNSLGRITPPFLQSFLVYYLSFMNHDNNCINIKLDDDLHISGEDDKPLALLLMDIFSLISDNIIKNEIQCGITIKNKITISIRILTEEGSFLAEEKEKCLNKLIEKYPDYSVILKKKGKEELFLLINK